VFITKQHGVHFRQVFFGGEGGSRTHVQDTFSRQFTTINQLKIVVLSARSTAFVVAQDEPCIAHLSLYANQHKSQLGYDRNHI